MYLLTFHLLLTIKPLEIGNEFTVFTCTHNTHIHNIHILLTLGLEYSALCYRVTHDHNITYNTTQVYRINGQSNVLQQLKSCDNDNTAVI